MRKFIIKSSGQLTLPVTPEGFELSFGRKTETVSVHELGEVNLPGGLALGSIRVGCMFPQNDYPFALDYGNPYDYVERLERMIRSKKPARFIISGTGVNERVLLEELVYGERDGTGDVYATLTMRGYRAVSASQTVGADPPRDESDAEQVEQRYTAVYGDCLCSICRQFYGDGSYALAKKLAAYNSRPNPNILYVGEILNIPPRAALGG